ncbi:MAG TPA: SPOR domain-containing protein [Burkholderiales bacterium]|jgi:DedD protein|nr:SPOR domain-containing protein [Burkholderiales bacterium]
MARLGAYEHGLTEMARPISDEELQLRKRARRRLIGAIAIVIAVVVALPMVLDNEPKPLTQDIDIRIPSPDTATPFTSKVVPVPGGTAPGAPAKPVPAPPETKAEAAPPAQTAKVEPAPAPVKEAPKSEPPAKSEKTAKAETPAAKTAPAKPAQSGQFVVQVVALSDAGKAKQMQQAIVRTGAKAYTEVVKTARGDVTRVRAGPYATREAAESAQRKLKGAGFDGKVVPVR